MKLATAPVNWNNDDAPDYRDWTPYPQLIKDMVAAGYSATEWGWRTDERTMEAPRPRTERVGKTASSGRCPGGFSQSRWDLRGNWS
jgi:hypothetical protein